MCVRSCVQLSLFPLLFPDSLCRRHESEIRFLKEEHGRKLASLNHQLSRQRDLNDQFVQTLARKEETIKTTPLPSQGEENGNLLLSLFRGTFREGHIGMRSVLMTTEVVLQGVLIRTFCTRKSLFRFCITSLIALVPIPISISFVHALLFNRRHLPFPTLSILCFVVIFVVVVVVVFVVVVVVFVIVAVVAFVVVVVVIGAVAVAAAD